MDDTIEASWTKIVYAQSFVTDFDVSTGCGEKKRKGGFHSDHKV